MAKMIVFRRVPKQAPHADFYKALADVRSLVTEHAVAVQPELVAQAPGSQQLDAVYRHAAHHRAAIEARPEFRRMAIRGRFDLDTQAAAGQRMQLRRHGVGGGVTARQQDTEGCGRPLHVPWSLDRSLSPDDGLVASARQAGW